MGCCSAILDPVHDLWKFRLEFFRRPLGLSIENLVKQGRRGPSANTEWDKSFNGTGHFLSLLGYDIASRVVQTHRWWRHRLAGDGRTRTMGGTRRQLVNEPASHRVPREIGERPFGHLSANLGHFPLRATADIR